jgi:hypothetical protein
MNSVSRDHAHSDGGTRADGGVHSPSPWTLEVGDSSHRYVLVTDDRDLTVMYKYAPGAPKDALQDEINARLISAAPDLLDVAQRVDILWRAIGDPRSGAPQNYEAMEDLARRASNALKKALGAATSDPSDRQGQVPGMNKKADQ